MNNNLIWERERLVVTALLLAIFLLGMGLRLYGLDADSLWADEIATAARAQRDTGALVKAIASGAGAGVQLPLTYLVTRFFIVFFGDSEFILRFQAMLFGSLSILLAYKVGEILWARQEGLIAAFLLAVNPFHIRYSQEARHYALMTFLALLSVIFLLKSLQRNRMQLWIGFVLCISLSLYNHYFAFLFLPAELIFATWVILKDWLPQQSKRASASQDDSSNLSIPVGRALMFSASLALIAASYLPWLPTLWTTISSELASQGQLPATLPQLSPSFDYFRHLLRTYSGVDGLATLLFTGLLVLGLASCKAKDALLIGSWVAIPFLFIFLVPSDHGFDPRHAIFVVPIFLLAIAHGLVRFISFLDRALRSTGWTQKWLIALSSSLVVVLGLANVASLRDYYRTQKEDWRGAAAYLKGNIVSGDLVLADGERLYGGDAIRVQHSLSFYLHRHGMMSVPILRTKRGLAQEVAQHIGEARGQVWAVIYHEDELATSERQDELVTVKFEDISVIRFEEPSQNLLEDTVSMLHVLRDLLPAPETHFDVHLALADIHLRIGRFEQAQLRIDMAEQVMPDTPKASRHMARVRAEFETLSIAGDEDIHYPLWQTFGLKIALRRGHDLEPVSVRAGETLNLTLWWQALTQMKKDYTGFVHLVDRDSQIWAQEDRLLQDGEHPTSIWEIGNVVRQEYQLELSPVIPPGDYMIQVGAYYWKTGDRLPLWDEERRRVDGDAILLGSITVTD